MIKVGTAVIIGFLALAGCGEDDTKEDTENTSGATVNAQKLQLLSTIEITPPVESNTPDSFKAGFSLMRLAKTDPKLYLEKLEEATLNLIEEDASALCAAKYDRDSTQFTACKTAYDVKDRYFSGVGPSDLARLTSIVDSRMSDVFRNTDWSYMPCFDEKNTAGGTYVETNSSNEKEDLTYPAYDLYEMPSTYTFQDNHSFDSGMKGYMSCYSSLGTSPDGVASWVTFGRKDGDYYIHEGQAAPSATGSLSKSSINGDVELFFTVGKQSSEFPDTFQKEYDNYDIQGAGLIYMKSFAETGLLELTSSGSGLSNASCSTHILTNGKMMYVIQNANTYGACTSDDNGIGIATAKTDNEPLAFDASKVDLEYCLNVSEASTISAYDNLDSCSDAGLSKTNLQLTTLTRKIIKGSHALYMFNNDLKDKVKAVQYVSVDISEPEGSATMTLPLALVSESENIVETACNASTTNQKTVALSYKLDVKTVIDAMVTDAEGSTQKSEDFNADDFRASLLKELTSSTGGTLKFTVAASAGGVKWADYSLTLTASKDGTSVATATYEELTDRTKGAQTGEISIDMTGITATSTIELKGTGALTLGCTNQDTATTGTATLRIGYPRLVYVVGEG